MQLFINVLKLFDILIATIIFILSPFLTKGGFKCVPKSNNKCVIIFLGEGKGERLVSLFYPLKNENNQY